MNISIQFNNQRYKLDFSRQHDISIPVDFNGKQPNFYNVSKADMKPLKTDSILWSVSEKAPCNVPEITLNIHCNGTHTESVGHLLSNVNNIGEIVKDIFIPSLLITLEPTFFDLQPEEYHIKINNNEPILTAEMIKQEISKYMIPNLKGLVVRTLPNNDIKKEFYYPETLHPFFTSDAIEYMNNIGIKHLFVDTPSIDRFDDDGILGNHRLFWSDIDRKLNKYSDKTITELCYISNRIKDGFYFINLQLPHFQLDAAPSRPILIETHTI